MTTTLTAPQPSLEERLADAERDLLVAQRALGEAIHDGGNEHEATNRVADARALVEGLRLAQAEGVRRAEDAAAKEAERQEAMARWTYLAWWAERFERLAPVFKLKAELRKAEEYAMEQPDLHPLLGKDNRWIVEEAEAGRLEFINLPDVTTVNVRPSHRVNTHCQGEATRAEDCSLTAEELVSWSKKLAPLVAQAAKPLGKDAKPEKLPWSSR